MVVPRHGSKTEGSHLLSKLASPRKGYIFSAPMYWKHKHPTYNAVENALDSYLENADEVQTVKHLIYFQFDQDNI